MYEGDPGNYVENMKKDTLSNFLCSQDLKIIIRTIKFSALHLEQTFFQGHRKIRRMGHFSLHLGLDYPKGLVGPVVTNITKMGKGYGN